MYLSSQKGCRLAIGSYPPFNYNATGGGGKAELIPTAEDNILKLKFNSDTFSIPPITSKTTKFISIPLPPGLKIEMFMEKLQGSIDKNTGKVFLRFESRFIFSIIKIFKFPDIFVNTLLETGKVKGDRHEAEGRTLQNNGETTLVGLAIIPKTGNKILDVFLDLPNEAIAELKCTII